MFTKRTPWILSLGIAFSFALTACGDKSTPAQSGAKPAENKPAAAKPAAQNSDAAWMDKANAHITLSNGWRRFMRHEVVSFHEIELKNEAKVAAGDFKAIKTNDHYFSERRMKDAEDILAKPADMPKADAALKKVVEAIKKLRPTWTALIDYNKSKKYEDDNGAKGKELLPAYQTGMAEFVAALNEHDAEVGALSKQLSEKVKAKYKAEGKLLELYTTEALDHGRAIIEIFDSTADLKNPQKIEAANAELAKLETSLEGMKKELEARKENLSTNASSYSSVISYLTKLAGEYREARKNPSAFNNAVNAFNQAIDSYNRIR